MNGTQQQRQRGLRPRTIVGIIFGDLAGIRVLAMIFCYVYQVRKRRKNVVSSTGCIERKDEMDGKDIWPLSSTEPKGPVCWCLGKKNDDGEELSETMSIDSDEDEEEKLGGEQQKKQQEQKGGSLIIVDGETELELETLLKASAYILGATSSSIVYKAVLEDGMTLAVRRIGESGIERYIDFENQVKLIAKLCHPNLVRIRGFYWGSEEKFVIYDYVPCGCLTNFSYSKFLLFLSSSGCLSQSVWCIVAKTSNVVLKCTVMLVSLCKGATVELRSYSQCPESQLPVVGR
ncbi:PREDICTED: probable LRR receptor-like serine/threonine-protein kinase At4g37250 [Nelumbo nucifera]|uniref:Probable LRR receptor-like serine/threonine-protein kinase At4g37250 n=1 Tax=Nelumbo nucifera TaxID=4432 RepID=A0A1U8Q6J9_NELNU|nr:PREDICTED: probable LRR receptor-like serine/threonine-protein kinase At4g37250 [Nelumbo nucifera]